MTESPELAGTIYDIGYRRYTGERLGRRAAIGAIIAAGLRAIFGLGRSGRSKVLPWGAVVLALLPAMVAIAIRVLAGDIIEIYSYRNYLWEIGLLLPIFLAAQAPELVVNDLRQQVVPLYFSRPISRLDYVGAKLAALAIGMLALTLLPLLLLFLGRVLAAEDVVAALGDEIGFLPAIVGSGLLHAVVLAGIGLAVGSLSSRRAYAAAAILAIFLVGSVMSATLAELGGTARDLAPFTYPLSILDGAREWLFGGDVSGSPAATAEVPPALYALAAAGLTSVSWAVLALRYRSVSA